MSKKTAAMIVARQGSSRFPKKATLPIGGKPLLEFLIHRLRAMGIFDSIILATSSLSQDQELIDIAQRAGAKTFGGDPEDVLRRMAQAIQDGLPAGSIRILDNPHLLQSRIFSNATDVTALRETFGLAPKKPVLLWLSDSLSEIEGGLSQVRSKYGFDEVGVVQDLVASLDSIDPGNEWQILIKTHPKEESGKFTFVTTEGQRIVRIAPHGRSLVDTFRVSDRWMGMFTAALLELNAYGCIPSRYEPGAKNDLLSGRALVHSRITDRTALASELKNYLEAANENVRFSPKERKSDYSELLRFLS